MPVRPIQEGETVRPDHGSEAVPGAASAAAEVMGDVGEIAEELRGGQQGALADLKVYAAQGNPVAANLLADAYAEGERVAHDQAEAARWWRRAADAGHPDAALALGDYLIHSAGPETSLDERQRTMSEALYRLTQAAVAGDRRAMRVLGYTLIDTPDVAPQAGVRWLERAGAFGDGRAWTLLALRYRGGAGVERDRVQAIACARAGVEAGDLAAAYTLDDLMDEVGANEIAAANQRYERLPGPLVV